MLGGAHGVVHGVEEEPPGHVVAAQRQAGEVCQGMVEIPGVDLPGHTLVPVGRLDLALALQVAQHAADIRVVEAREAGLQLVDERDRFAAPLLVLVQRRQNGELHHALRPAVARAHVAVEEVMPVHLRPAGRRAR